MSERVMVTHRLLFIALLATCGLFGRVSADTVQSWLLLDKENKESLFVTDPVEKTNLEKDGWKASGTGLLALTGGEDRGPLHRMAKAGDDRTIRMFEVDAAKMAAHRKAGFADEGMLGYAFTKAVPEGVEVHRLTQKEHSLWVIASDQVKDLTKQGWKREGVAFWLKPLAQSAKTTSRAEGARSAK